MYKLIWRKLCLNMDTIFYWLKYFIFYYPTLFLINILIIRLYFGYVLANWITKQLTKKTTRISNLLEAQGPRTTAPAGGDLII